MAKQTRGQKDTVERVMHEYKHGELKSGSGRKVKSRKQAVAIALSEAGESKYETPAKNKENLRKTKTKERKGETGRDARERKAASKSSSEKSKADLYAQAREKDIPGRSKMDKAGLERALRK